MPIELYELEIPSLITWFNGFVGFSELQNRIGRAETKLKDVGFEVPVLNRRFSFHTAYKRIIVKNRLCQRIDVRQIENNRALSFIAGMQKIAKGLSGKPRNYWRSRILDSLSPDRDLRELEHEIRAYIHYRNAGLEIYPVDGENNQRFDFLVKGLAGEFELECKTFHEDIGSSTSIDECVHIFRAFASAYKQAPSLKESGILTLTLLNRNEMSEDMLTSILSDFFCKCPKEKTYRDLKLSFERKRDWDDQLRTGNVEMIANEIKEQYEMTYSNTLIVSSRKLALMFCVSSARRSRPLNGIFRSLKDASDQFSGQRPAVIWGHFLAAGETDFRQLIEPRSHMAFRPLDVIGHRLFRSRNRDHVCRLRFSVEADAVREMKYQVFVPGRSSAVTGSGLAFDSTSHVSRFDPQSTQ